MDLMSISGIAGDALSEQGMSMVDGLFFMILKTKARILAEYDADKELSEAKHRVDELRDELEKAIGMHDAAIGRHHAITATFENIPRALPEILYGPFGSAMEDSSEDVPNLSQPSSVSMVSQDEVTAFGRGRGPASARRSLDEMSHVTVEVRLRKRKRRTPEDVD